MFDFEISKKFQRCWDELINDDENNKKKNGIIADKTFGLQRIIYRVGDGEYNRIAYVDVNLENYPGIGLCVVVRISEDFKKLFESSFHLRLGKPLNGWYHEHEIESTKVLDLLIGKTPSGNSVFYDLIKENASQSSKSTGHHPQRTLLL